MINEIWKPIAEYEGLYEVSNLGRVKSLNYNHTHKEKILSPVKSGRGYLAVKLCKHGEIKRAHVHRLVGKAFVGGWFDGAVINHKDHNPENNVYTNLEWTTQKDNSSPEKSFGPEICAKLFTNGILAKRVLQFTKAGEFVREWQSTMEVERQTGFASTNVCACCNRKRKSANGFVWKYKETVNA